MMVQAHEEMGEGPEIPTDPYHTPIITQPSLSQPQRKQKSRKSKKKNTEVPQPSGSTDNVPDENVLDLEKAKTAQDSEIASLNKKVKKLERRNKSRTPGLKRLRKVGSARRVESSDEANSGRGGVKVEKVVSTAEVTTKSATTTILLADHLELLNGNGVTLMFDQHKQSRKSCHLQNINNVHAIFMKDSESNLVELNSEDSFRAHDYLVEKEPKTCSKAFFNEGIYYEAVENGFSECFNIFLCDDLLVKLNESEFKAATYKRGLATLEDQIKSHKKNEVLFSEEVAVLKREVGCKNYETNVLKSELEKIKQEKDGIDFKIEKFDKASKDLDHLLEVNTEKSKKGFGSLKSKCYGPENSKQESNVACEKESHNSKENSDESLVEERVSQDKSSFVESSSNADKETVFLLIKRATHHDDKGFIDIRCSRHMTRNNSKLLDFQEFDRAKRRNRILIEADRIVLADSKLPTTFWVEAVSTAFYVQNRLLVVKPHNKTPYELFRGTSEENSQDCIVMPIWKDTLYFDSPTKDVDNGKPKTADDAQKQVEDGPNNENDEQERYANDSSTKDVNAAGQQINTASPDVNTDSLKLNDVGPSVSTAIQINGNNH
ncbi:hypothetical protein Tco_0129041 [Tanacetum coccineum]